MSDKDFPAPTECNVCKSSLKVNKKGYTYCANLCWTKTEFDSIREDLQKEADSTQCPFCLQDNAVSRLGYVYCTNVCWKKEPYRSERLKDIREKFEIIMENILNIY